MSNWTKLSESSEKLSNLDKFHDARGSAYGALTELAYMTDGFRTTSMHGTANKVSEILSILEESIKRMDECFGNELNFRFNDSQKAVGDMIGLVLLRNGE